MAAPQLSREALKAMASLCGLKLSDQRLDEYLPQLRRSAEAMAELDALGLEGVEPAIIFKADRG